MTTPSFTLNVPINAVSFGNVAIALLREIHKRGLTPSIMPIGPVDLASQFQDPAFNQWLVGCINTAPQRCNRQNTALKLWHIQGGLETYSARDSRLLTFFELDSLTPAELNILRNQSRVYVTSTFTQQVFAQFGVVSHYVPLGFDAANFKTIPVRPTIKDVISFGLFGKYERRKSHPQVLRAWAKRYGNKKEYRLNCAIHNPFLKPEDQNALIGQALEGKQYWNINWLPWAGTNAEYNCTLQGSDIILSLSGGEGRDLPCYHATALGAWPIAMRAHAYLDYLTDENAVLVNPNGKTPAVDGVFFQPNAPFNNGNLFSFSDDDFYVACDEAEKRVKTLGINKKGLELQTQTYAPAVDILLKDLVG